MDAIATAENHFNNCYLNWRRASRRFIEMDDDESLKALDAASDACYVAQAELKVVCRTLGEPSEVLINSFDLLFPF